MEAVLSIGSTFMDSINYGLKTFEKNNSKKVQQAKKDQVTIKNTLKILFNLI